MDILIKERKRNMALLDYYTKLYTELNPTSPQAISVTIRQCVSYFHCSDRNTKLIIRRLHEEGYISWEAGRGRGNTSKITFLKPLDKVIKDEVMHDIREGKLDKALRFLNEHALPETILHECHGLLQSHFGFQVENQKEKSIDILRIPMRRHFATLDPAFAAITSEAHISHQIFDCLINYNVVTNQFEEHLAHSWTTNVPKTEWTFYLRKGILFHHGKECTSQDVKFTFQRIRDQLKQIPCRWYLDDLDEFKTINDYAFTLIFRKPKGFLLHLLSSINCAILASDVGYDHEHNIGTSPFRILKYDKKGLLLHRFENYFKERALLDRIELLFAPHLVNKMKRYDVPSLSSKEKGYHAKVHQENGCSFLLFNFRVNGIQEDKNVRCAIRALINQRELISKLKGNRFAPASRFIPSHSKLHPRAQETFDDAKRYLVNSSYNGETLHVYYFDHKETLNDAVWLKDKAEKIGLNLSLHAFPLENFYEHEVEEKADILFCGEVLEENMELGLANLFKNSTSLLRRFLNDEQRKTLDHLMQFFIEELDSEKRMQKIEEIERSLTEDINIIYLYHNLREMTFHAALAGITLNAFGWADFSKLWIKP